MFTQALFLLKYFNYHSKNFSNLENQVNKNKKYILRFFLQSFFAGNVHEGIDVLQLIK